MKILRTGLLLLTSVVVALFIGEWLYSALVVPPDVVPRSLGRFDTLTGWALKPNASGKSRATGKVVTYHINSRGIRDDETPYEKPAGVFRIVLLGDSRTFGYGVPIEQHFTRLLEGFFQRVEVVNLGVSGFGVDQELLSLRTEGLRYDPDLVIAYVAHFEDQRHMYAERFGKQKPMFTVEGDSLLLHNVPVPTPTAGMGPIRRIDWYLTTHSALYSGAMQLIFGGYNKGVVYSSDLAPEFSDRMYATATRIIIEMDRVTRQKGAGFLLVHQLPHLGEMCAGQGLRTLDLTPVLNNPLLALSPELSHLNEAGNGIWAATVARYLMSEGLVPARHLRPLPNKMGA